MGFVGSFVILVVVLAFSEKSLAATCR